LQNMPFTRTALVVTNPVVKQHYGEIVLRSLQSAGYHVSMEEIPAGEEVKTMETAMRLYDRAVQLGMDRKSPIFALGGGVVGDLTGFVAATYMRGIPFIQIPTTLLAQVDSSVGGKVAVNHPQGKNLIGAFYQPKLVLIDPATLATLPEREWLSGMAEVIKYGVIDDADLFALLSQGDMSMLRGDREKMTYLIRRACEIKAKVVAADEKEQGLRMILNYGHTIGHAIERAGAYRKYTHGEAVAIGMAGAARLACKIGWCEKQKCSDIENAIIRYGLPVRYKGLSPVVVEEGLYHDKKQEGGKIRWVLPKDIGVVGINGEVPDFRVREVLEELSVT
jgi:3-dehydroquinate synthase